MAKLYLDTLGDKTSAWEVRQTLRQFRAQSLGSTEVERHKVLDVAYDEAMKRIRGQKSGFRQLAEKVLCWIICAQRPMTTSEIQTALAVEVGDRELNEEKLKPINRMVSVCAGLVTVDEESDIIRLVHYTTQEYFQRTQAQWFPTAEADIATICITYLSFDVFGSGSSPTDDAFNERLHSNQLYQYAASNWGRHARMALDSSQEIGTSPQGDCKSRPVELVVKIEETRQAVMEFLERKGNFEASVQALFATESWPNLFIWSQNFPRATTLHLAAYFGLELTSNALLATGAVDPGEKDSNGRTPLSWAAEYGNEGIVKLLLGTGNVDPDARDNGGRTPLSFAAGNGHTGVVKLLLNTARVDPDAEDDRSRTPLSLAAKDGHEAVVKVLLATGSVNPDAKDDVGQTPLSLAAEKGHEAVVRLLATASVDFDARDRSGWTALHWAARYGHETIVKLLLATDSVDPDGKDDKSRTPLHLAASNDHGAVVKLLLGTASVDPDARDNKGRTPLSHVAEYGYDPAMRRS